MTKRPTPIKVASIDEVDERIEKVVEKVERAVRSAAQADLFLARDVRKDMARLSRVVTESKQTSVSIARDNHKLRKQLIVLEAKVDALEATKMTKPSVAQELTEAERYVDDYNKLKKEYRRKRWARKQRIQGKIARIAKANRKKTSTSWRTIAWYVVTIAALATFAVVGI